jgi:hypothetical protein
MEGHPGYEDRRAAPVRGGVDSSDVTRKRAFLLLEGERRSLAGHLRPLWRPRRRYEDLSLVIMLARLERDWLSQPWPDPVGADRHGAHRHQPASRLAGWAMPWGAAPRAKLEADIDHMGDALKGLDRWLPRRTVAEAERGARRRLAIITTGLQEPGPRAWTAVPAPPQGPAPHRPRFEAPSRRRAAAVAALLLLGAGAFLLAGTEQGSGPDSIRRAGGGAGVGENQHATNVQIPGGSEQGRRGPDRPGNRKARSNARASSQGSARNTAVASEPVPAPPEPPPVAEPVAAPQPAPAPVPASSPSTSSQAKGAGGCPPEFGYEC